MVYSGRTKIILGKQGFTDEELPSLLQKAFAIHQANAKEIRYLRRYYLGEQPILDRIKVNRPEITNKIIENHAYEIVEFNVGYAFGEPIQYVQRGDNSVTKDNEMDEDNPISVLNEYMAILGKASIDRELAEDMHIGGVGYKGIFPAPEDKEAPFKIVKLNPETTFVVYANDVYQEPLFAVSYYVNDVGAREGKVYSTNFIWDFSELNGVGSMANLTGKKLNVSKQLPIIEYPLNPSYMGCFEIVLSLLDTLNNIASNRMDGIEQFVQSFIKFINCDIDEDKFKELKDLGAIAVKSPQGVNAEVDIIASDLDQSQVQIFVENVYQNILTIVGVPDRNASAGGNTGQALIIGQGWASTESRTKSKELMFRKSEKLFLKQILSCIACTTGLDPKIYELKLSDIDVKFTRNKTDNLLVKTQGLLNLLEAGVHPRISFGLVGLFNDSEQAYEDSVDYLDKWTTNTLVSDNTNPPEISNLDKSEVGTEE